MPTNPPITDRPTSRPPVPSSASRRRTQRAITVLAAMLAAVLVWILIVPIFGIDLTVDTGSGTTPVTAFAVAGAAMLAGAAGWAVLAVLEHLTRSAVPVWTVVAGAVLVVSLAGPLAAGSVAATVSLIVLHLIVGSVVVLGMRRSGRHW